MLLLPPVPARQKHNSDHIIPITKYTTRYRSNHNESMAHAYSGKIVTKKHSAMKSRGFQIQYSFQREPCDVFMCNLCACGSLHVYTHGICICSVYTVRNRIGNMCDNSWRRYRVRFRRIATGVPGPSYTNHISLKKIVKCWDFSEDSTYVFIFNRVSAHMFRTQMTNYYTCTIVQYYIYICVQTLGVCWYNC